MPPSVPATLQGRSCTVPVFVFNLSVLYVRGASASSLHSYAVLFYGVDLYHSHINSGPLPASGGWCTVIGWYPYANINGKPHKRTTSEINYVRQYLRWLNVLLRQNAIKTDLRSPRREAGKVAAGGYLIQVMKSININKIQASKNKISINQYVIRSIQQE